MRVTTSYETLAVSGALEGVQQHVARAGSQAVMAAAINQSSPRCKLAWPGWKALLWRALDW